MRQLVLLLDLVALVLEAAVLLDVDALELLERVGELLGALAFLGQGRVDAVEVGQAVDGQADPLAGRVGLLQVGDGEGLRLLVKLLERGQGERQFRHVDLLRGAAAAGGGARAR